MFRTFFVIVYFTHVLFDQNNILRGAVSSACQLSCSKALGYSLFQKRCRKFGIVSESNISGQTHPVGRMAIHPSGEPVATVVNMRRRRRMDVDDYVKTATAPFGSGSQGAVFKAKHRVTGEPVVVKTFKNVDTGSREAWALYRLQAQKQHRHIICYKACSPCCKYIVLELAEGVEMLDVAQRHGGIDDSRARPLFAQMLAGVQHMHSSGLAHMDLKLENLILTKQGVAKWLDFGLSVIHQARGESGSWEREAVPFSGSKAYCAPEALAGQAADGFAADVWSLGVCLFALSTSRFPFDAANESDMRYNTFLSASRAGTSPLRSIYRTADFPLSDGLADLLEGMLVVDPKHRFTLDQVRAHHWLRPQSA